VAELYQLSGAEFEPFRILYEVGGALAAGLVLLYITQYPFGSVTTADPYYLQRLGLRWAHS
jgi:hypothetical protein